MVKRLFLLRRSSLSSHPGDSQHPSNASLLDFAHGNGTSLGTGRVKCFTYPNSEPDSPPQFGGQTEGRSKKRRPAYSRGKTEGIFCSITRLSIPMNFRNFFTTRARIARPPDPPLDRFENEHPESFAFPPHRMLDAIGYAKFRSRSYDAVIRVYDDAGNVIETHEHADFKNGRFLLH
jgi:hypothetical protein